jgi:uncharacterized protein YjeT (DUF2065 family)
VLTILLAGIGVAIALEGAAYALAPGGMKRLIAQLGEMSPDQLRLAGLTALCLGVAIVWAVLG